MATIQAADRDRCLDLAAQLAFYFLLALFPILLVIVALLGFFPVDNASSRALVLLAPVAPGEVINLLAVQLKEITRDGRAGLATLGGLGAIWTGSSAMASMIGALNRVYAVPEWRPWWKRRLLALGLTIGFGVFMTASLLLMLMGPGVTRMAADLVGLSGLVSPVWAVLRWPLMVGLVIISIDVVYRFAPNRRTRGPWTSPGSLVATVLWIGSSLLFKVYVVNLGTYNVTYGAIGGVIVGMIWLYLSSLAILVGAEWNRVVGGDGNGGSDPGSGRRP
ncbi:MAG: YihY/virulence factor BrkB family protein [Vicinamibacterales bacterium]